MRVRGMSIALLWPGDANANRELPMKPHLKVVNGRANDCEIPLPGTILMIGRDPRCHLRPHCPLVSRLHCAIAQWAGRVVVRDLKSSNGTLINSRRIHGEVAVQDGDSLQVGQLVLMFCIPDGPQANRLRESEVRWLLEAPEDPPDAEGLTCQELPVVLDRPHESSVCPAISAGEYLRSLVRSSERPG